MPNPAIVPGNYRVSLLLSVASQSEFIPFIYGQNACRGNFRAIKYAVDRQDNDIVSKFDYCSRVQTVNGKKLTNLTRFTSYIHFVIVYGGDGYSWQK